ncbi:unnamed protein product [Allacma fusca]|uniref:C2H2-type domain-containing protein n=1 Tax=Allacma fusca TaxID=39272 RepID=A0A8J2LV68_9HEXA|nr:unnamed protein product [Allacma fusca]
MSFLLPNFESREGLTYLQNEILRLQDLCAENFGKIDELRKENKKLQEIHTELKETTSDLAYSLAECPWWQKESLQSAVKILASFAQKIQYILELPTFIDPVEQLNRNGGFDRCEIAKILKRRSSKAAVTTPFVRTCGKCKKRFYKVSNYEIHKRIHPVTSRKLRCKVCTETFSSFVQMKIHLKNFHSFVSGADEDTYSSLRQILQKNHVEVLRFFKCKYCDLACSSMPSLKRHIGSCRSMMVLDRTTKLSHGKGIPVIPKITESPAIIETSNNSPADPTIPLLVHEDTSEDDDEDMKPVTEEILTEAVNSSSTPITIISSTTEKPEELKEDDAAVPGPTLTIAQAPVRLATMHSFSISSPTYRSGEGGEGAEGGSSNVLQDPAAYFLTSSSSSVESEVETSVIQEPDTGECLRKFICTHHQCLKAFSTRGKLAHHRKSHTKGSVLLSCQFCGKEFHDKYRMKTHWLSHCPDGLTHKPVYRCLECGKFHRNLNELADHSQKAHSVSQLRKPLYSCASCGFTTNFRRKFDVHLKRKCKGRQVVEVLPQEGRRHYCYPAVALKSVETCTSSTSNSVNN